MAPLHVIFSPGAGVPRVHWAHIVKLLLDGGADPNIKTTKNGGWTPLHQAVRANHPDVVKLLLEASADPDIPNNKGRTPLYVAAQRSENKDIDLVKLLLEHGTNPNLTFHPKKRTPLYVAARKSKSIILSNNIVVKLLLENGADQNITDNKGRTPLDKAKNDAIKVILLTHITPQEIEKLALPFLMALKRKRKESKTFPKMPKDMRNLLVQYIIIEDKLKKAKQYLPNFDEDKLRTVIEKGVIEALRRTRKKYPYITHDPDPFGTFYHGD